MSKKRYTLYISRPLARKFDLVAQQRNGAKSALVEEALRASLEPQQHPGVEEGLARRFNELNKSIGAIRRDVTVATETLALFVRYFLTITPPLPQSEQEPARLLGRERFDVFVGEIGRRIAENERLVTDVLATITINQPDLFAIVPDDAPSSSRHAPEAPSQQENGHG